MLHLNYRVISVFYNFMEYVMKKKDTMLYGFIINDRIFDLDVERITLTLEDFTRLFNGGTLHDSNPDSDTYGCKLETPKLENTYVFWNEKDRDNNVRLWERRLEEAKAKELRNFVPILVHEYPRNAELSISYSKVLPLQK